MGYILAFDQGTTSSRSIVFDRAGSIVGVGQKEITQIFPQSGWVEHDPEEIWTSQIETAQIALDAAGLTPADITGIGITNQRETTIIWDRSTGIPIYNAIVWQDRRTSDVCNTIRSADGAEIRQATGLEVDAYFSASKIKWLLDTVPDARPRAEAGELAFGTVDSWLIWKLTGGRLHITDPSNASRTMLFNITDRVWDAKMLDIFDIPYAILPEVRSSSEIYGQASLPEGLRGVKIAGIAGDQQAALFGQACFHAGMTKNTYGTGCFMLQNVGDIPEILDNRLLTTIAWEVAGLTEYAIEGSVFVGGAVVQWLRDGLGLIPTSSAVEGLAGSVTDHGGIYLVPAFAGLGSPYWNQEARGLIIGITRGTSAAHIARAAVESIAFQTADLLAAMNGTKETALTELRVDGGASHNDDLLQFQADILGIPVLRSNVAETTALGAAYLAGLAVGFWDSKEEIAEHWKIDRRFESKMTAAARSDALGNWHRAVERSLDWIQ